MASNPSSSTSKKTRHARNTSVIPALPSLSAKEWRRSIHTPSASIASDLEPTPTSPATAPKPLINGAASPLTQQIPRADTASEAASSQVPPPDLEDVTIQDEIRPNPAHIEAAPSSSDYIDETELPPQLQEHQAHSGEPETERAASSLPSDALHLFQETVNHLQHALDTDPAIIADTEPPEEKQRVRLGEDEAQPSENETSSVEPSSGTAITDYGSTAGDSTLETVIDESHHPRQAPDLIHRKSEAAPEALTNGFSPRSTNGSGSHPIDHASSLARPKPAPLPSLHEHLQILASTKQFYDTIVYVNHPDTTFQPSEHYTHSLFLARSEVLVKILAESDLSQSPRIINLYPARNLLPHAFEAALRFFYSDNVLTAQSLIPQGAYPNTQIKRQTFEYVMSYWIAGVELGLLPIKARAYDIVQELLDWDIAESVAKEIQDLRIAEEALPNLHDKVEIRDIADSLSRLLSQLLLTRVGVRDLAVVFDAQPAILPTRFAALEAPRSNNPALSSMVFGSLPSEPSQAPSSDSIVSAILLNVTFDELSKIAQRLTSVHGMAGEQVIRQAIEHREEKRVQMVNNRAISNKHRLSNSGGWDLAGWKESVDEYGHLNKERVGFLLPTRNR